MRLGHKLVLAMIFVALAPFGLSGYSVLVLSRSELEARIREVLEKTSAAEAEIIGREVADLLHSLRLLASVLAIRPDNLTALGDATARVYLLSDRFNAALLLNSAGQQVGPAIFVDDRRSFPPQYQTHEEVDAEELTRFVEQARRVWPAEGGCAADAVYSSPRKGPLMVCAAPTMAGHWFVVELSLSAFGDRVAGFRVGRNGFAFLADAAGLLIAHPDRRRAENRESAGALARGPDLAPGQRTWLAELEDPTLGQVIAAGTRVSVLGWWAVVVQPKSEALAPVRALLFQLGAWLVGGLGLAAVLGLALAGRIVRPVRELVQGALAIANGRLDQQIGVRSRDEIGQLGMAFNHMGSELQKHRRRIEVQNEEIRRWNLELQDRVEARTRELKETQDLLLQAQKMAAVGELGAGIAHEINNPLMAVIGCAQLLLMRHPPGDPDRALLEDIDREGLRIREITGALLQATQGGEDMARVDLRLLAEHVALIMGPELARRSVALELRLPEGLPPIMGNLPILEESLMELLQNAIHAMPNGGRVSLQAEVNEPEIVRLRISDTGIGIPKEFHKRVFEPFFTTKQNWNGRGLGLAKVFQAMKRHGGHIQVEDREGPGATFSLTFPALPRSLHLV